MSVLPSAEKSHALVNVLYGSVTSGMVWQVMPTVQKVGASKSVHYFSKCMELCVVWKKLGRCCGRDLGAKSLPVACRA